MSFEWHGEEAKKKIDTLLAQKLEACAIVVENKAKESISEPSPPVSDPGTPPHKDTGRLRTSVSHELDAENFTARVGTNVPYGKWLEIGTWKMAARPWLRPALEACRGLIKRILGTK